jgi:hypothetical protein
MIQAHSRPKKWGGGGVVRKIFKTVKMFYIYFSIPALSSEIEKNTKTDSWYRAYWLKIEP